MKEVVIFFLYLFKKKALFVLDGTNVEHFSQAKSKKGGGGVGGVGGLLKNSPRYPRNANSLHSDSRSSLVLKLWKDGGRRREGTNRAFGVTAG